ncbi:hypothetical protein Vretimale_4754, partial [Volvox reticuliferus]
DRLQAPLLKRRRCQGLELQSSPIAHDRWQGSPGIGLAGAKRLEPALCSTPPEQMYWGCEVNHDDGPKERLRVAIGTADAVPSGLHQRPGSCERPDVSFEDAGDCLPNDFECYQRGERRMCHQLDGGWNVEGGNLGGGD